MGNNLGFEIEQILHIHKAEFEPLKAASIAEGHLFLERMASDWDSGKDRFQQASESFWGAYSGDELLGVCGLGIDPHENNPKIARVRHLYVMPIRRREGVGRALVHVVMGLARENFTALQVRADNPLATAFFERIGFLRVDSAHATHRMHFQKENDVSG